MKLITEPKVFVIGKPQVDHATLREFLDTLSRATAWASDEIKSQHLLSEVAGRLCYLSFFHPRPGGNVAYLQHILESAHGSVLEHTVWNFIITGVSRSLTHELVRHRAGWSYSELSQRYVDCSDVAFVVPPALLPWKVLHDQEQSKGFAVDPTYRSEAEPIEMHRFRQWKYCREDNVKEYHCLTQSLLDKAPAELTGTDRRKWARQAARSVLPECTETKIFVTVNARALRHFIELRCSRHADAEIRRLAGVILDVMQLEAPNLFGDYLKVPLPDGSFEAATRYRKV